MGNVGANRGNVARTGTDTEGLVDLAVSLLAAGAILVLIARSRRRSA